MEEDVTKFEVQEETFNVRAEKGIEETFSVGDEEAVEKSSSLSPASSFIRSEEERRERDVRA